MIALCITVISVLLTAVLFLLHIIRKQSERIEARQRLVNAYGLYGRELMLELTARNTLLAAMHVYQQSIEIQLAEQREEIEEIYLRRDIITEAYQSLIDQQLLRISQLLMLLELARRKGDKE